MKVLVEMFFGSRLYGTAGPDSDLDFKGIFMPSRSEVLLGRIPKSVQSGTGSDASRKNAATDVDREHYSIHYFVELALRGETVALDMLHAPRSALIRKSSCWYELQRERHRFYTRNLRALVGYARRQAAKYGVKGSRLADARQVLEVLETAPAGTRIRDLDLPALEHARWLEPDPRAGNLRSYEVCGRKLMESSAVEHYLETLRRFVDAYGERARMAERNEGVDWKAVSHALRAGYQTRLILTEGGFSFPLPETDTLVKVKRGEMPYYEAAALLEDLIDEVEELSRGATHLPEKADKAWWDEWLMYWVGEVAL